MKVISNYEMDITNNNFFTATFKNSFIGFAVLFFVISACLFPLKTAKAVNEVKWHPGHYYILFHNGKSSDSYMNTVYGELERTPALRGIQARFSWSELETAKGVYNFALIDKLLAQLSARKKRLFVHIGIKSFSPDESSIPNYLKTPEYEGGEFIYVKYNTSIPKGKYAKLWNAKVRDRLVALYIALGKRYNSHPYFEGTTMNETAWGAAMPRLTTEQENTFFDNLAIVHQKMRAAFPNSVNFQYLNFPRSQLSELISKFKQSRTGIGCPDVFTQDPGLNFAGTANSPPGIYKYYPKNSGVLPLMVQIEHANYLDTRADLQGYQPTVTELLNFGRDNLQVNYLFWTRTPGYYDNVLELLNFKQQKVNASGGLRAACPSTFSSCKTD